MSNTIRLMSFNIHKGFGSFNRSFNLPLLREAIRNTDVDIVCLQEVLGEHAQWAVKHAEHWPENSQYEYLADSIWQEYAYGKNAVYPNGHHGNAVLSKHAIAHWENHDISLSGIEQRGVLCVELPLGRVESTQAPEEGLSNSPASLFVLCTHLSLREPHRQEQIRKIFSIIETLPPDAPLVLAGDFNDWRTKAHPLCEAFGLVEANQHIHQSLAKTFPALCPVLRLDRIYTRNVKIVNAEVLSDRHWSKLSDHRPVLAELELSH